jgi:hypothetical protein
MCKWNFIYDSDTAPHTFWNLYIKWRFSYSGDFEEYCFLGCNVVYKIWSFCGDRIQQNFLSHAATLRCKSSPSFHRLTPSPSSGCCWWLGKTKLLTRCPVVCCVYLLCPSCTEVFTTHCSTPSYQFWFYQAISNTPKMGTESVLEMLENFYTLTQLSTQEYLIE